MKHIRPFLVALALLAWATAHAGEAPVLLSPVNGMELADVATYFQWLPVPDCTQFEIQIARDAAFTDVVKTKQTVNKGYHKNLYFPKDILAQGTYFWRVRALPNDQQGSWSETRTLKVNAEHPVLPTVVRAISPERPLFLMRSRAWNPLLHTEHINGWRNSRPKRFTSNQAVRGRMDLAKASTGNSGMNV